jgi:acyl-CoA reductase-like NAD-dependent aldehyde dehydrogenase
VTETAALQRYRLYPDGDELESAGETFAAVSPTAGEPWARFEDARAEDVDVAVGAAAGHDAFLQTESVWIELDETIQDPFVLKL